MPEVKPEVTLLSWTGTLFPAYAAARTCYTQNPPKDTSGLLPALPYKCVTNEDGTPGEPQAWTQEELEKLPQMAMEAFLREKIIKRGHMGILEHLSFSFLLEGVSRAFSHQLVRHRVGISFAQQSQRYCNLEKGFNFIVPPTVAAANITFESGHSISGAEYLESVSEYLLKAYQRLIDSGVPGEDARFVLPNACETKLVMTVNARQLIEVSRKRLCLHAQWEVRRMFGLIKKATQEACPLVAEQMGMPCQFGPCPENDVQCPCFGRSNAHDTDVA